MDHLKIILELNVHGTCSISHGFGKRKKKFFFANAIFIQIYFKNTYASTP
jgi:hypothetical protein